MLKSVIGIPALVLVTSMVTPVVLGAQGIGGPSISSGPGSVVQVPVNGPVALGWLAAALLLAGWWFLQRGQDPHRLAPLLLLVALSGTMMQSTGLLAQVVASFTDPAGETLPIEISPITTGEGIAGFEPADFTNTTSFALRVIDLVPPTFAECFPGGSVSTLLPPGPTSPSPHPDCSVGLTLNPADTCRVDVETLCRDLAAANTATLSVTPTLELVVNDTGDLTVTNSAASPVAADNVAATIPGGSDISVQSTSCPASLAVGASCTITLTSAVVEGPTTIEVAGDNTNSATSDVTVVPPPPTLTAVDPSTGPASGGTGVTLTGTNLVGATSVTFGGTSATFVNVVNSTTVTAVTPQHAAGGVDVAIATPDGSATLTNGYTYVSTAVGQPSGGGVIAGLDGGLNDLIAVVSDNSAGIEWGGSGAITGAQSDTDGASNTVTIVTVFGNNGGTPYAAQLCFDFEVDSQGNTPCQAGNACYDDWFLPAKDQLNVLFTNRVALGGFANATYWSSTEFSGSPTLDAWGQDFSSGLQFALSKSLLHRTRCVRAFVP